LPGWLSDILFGPSAVLELVQEPQVLGADRVSGGSVQRLFDEPVQDGFSTSTRRRLRSLSRLSFKSLVLRLLPDETLLTQIEVPVSAAARLEAAVEAEISRFTPFRPEDVYHDYSVASVDPDREMLRLHLIVARKSDVERLLQVAQAAGLKVQAVSGPRSGQAEVDVLNLLPMASRARPRRPLLLISRVLIVLALVGLAANAGLTYRHKSQRQDLAERPVTTLRSTAIEASELQQKLEEQQRVAGLLAKRWQTTITPVAAINAVSRTLGPDHWLVSLEMKGSNIAMAGFSKDPTAMLRLLERSAMLTNARFTAPVTRNEQTGQSRFFLSVDLAPQAGGLAQ